MEKFGPCDSSPAGPVNGHTCLNSVGSAGVGGHAITVQVLSSSQSSQNPIISELTQQKTFASPFKFQYARAPKSTAKDACALRYRYRKVTLVR